MDSEMGQQAQAAALVVGVVVAVLVIGAVIVRGPTSTPNIGPGQPAQPTASSTPAATFSLPTTFAVACGVASERVAKTGSTDATFVLNSPGRSPLRIAWTGNAPVDAAVPAGYICVLLEAGAPFPVLSALVGPYQEGFISEGAVPATFAKPAPAGFVLPQACAFVASPVVSIDSTVWAVDCGTQANRDARGALGAAMTQQGWVTCGVGVGAMSAQKNGVMLLVTESSLAPGDYPRLTQSARSISPCS
jgi:hypothetical protein